MKKAEIDDYISNCADFAEPILTHLRNLIHEAIPTIEEDIKWKMPSFELNGKIVCSIAGFKKHCVLRFWKGCDMKDPENILLQIGKTDMSHIGNITTIEGLPNDKVLKDYIINSSEVI